MKITQISDHIWSVRKWVFFPIHVWLVIEEDGVTLVDTGISSMASGIWNTIEKLQSGPLKRIMLTHGHLDHIGSLSLLLLKEQVPVYAHDKEIPYLEGKLSYQQGKKAYIAFPEGSILALPEEDDGKLQSIGDLTPFLTAGHSPGHTVYYHEKDQVLLAGDLFWSKKGRLRKPRFTPNLEETLESSRIVSELQPYRLEVSHGDSVLRPADQIDAYIERNKK